MAVAVGALCGRSRWVLGSFALLSATAGLLPHLGEFALSPAQVWLPRAIFALLAAFAAVFFAVASPPLNEARLERLRALDYVE